MLETVHLFMKVHIQTEVLTVQCGSVLLGLYFFNNLYPSTEESKLPNRHPFCFRHSKGTPMGAGSTATGTEPVQF